MTSLFDPIFDPVTFQGGFARILAIATERVEKPGARIKC